MDDDFFERQRPDSPFLDHDHARPDDGRGPSSSASSSSRIMLFSRRCARRLERSCCTCMTYFPLAFVYGLTTWAAWVQVRIGSAVVHARAERGASSGTTTQMTAWVGPGSSAVAVLLYLMLAWCYTTAVFTSPGSTTNDQGYSTVLGHQGRDSHAHAHAHSHATATALTVKANGELRFCKKCQARKPDRAHHCSTCRRCVLKMDHHCPWLATCIGLRNAKAFVLFLVYTTLYSLFAFAVSASWVWVEVASDVTYVSYDDSLMPIQYIMLCVIAGIIGLVVGLFTAWHIWLACRGMTTIECMEKTRYQSPLRGKPVTMAYGREGAAGGGGVPPPQYGHQLQELQGGGGRLKPPLPQQQRLWDEEQGRGHNDYDDHDDCNDSGDDDGYNETQPLHRPAAAPHDQMGRRLTFNEMERYRAQKRHDEYLDEQDNKALPHAFDLGLRRNLRHLLGPSPWLWALPIGNTTGDGWAWEPSPKWLAARQRIRHERDAQAARERAAGWGVSDDEGGGRISPAPRPVVNTVVAAAPRPEPLVAYATNGNNNVIRRGPLSRPSSAGLSPSKADRVLGRDPRLYPNTSSSPVASPLSAVSIRPHDLDDIDLDDDDDDDDLDELDNTSDEDATVAAAVAPGPPRLSPAQAQPSPSLPSPASAASAASSQRPSSPFRSRWMPASGLLHAASARSPTRETAGAQNDDSDDVD